MRYMGSKNRIAKELIHIIQPNTTGVYVEPFVGACGMMRHVKADFRMGCDSNKYLVALWNAVQNGWTPPTVVSEEQYAYVKTHKEEDLALTAFVGFGCSFGGKFFGGYARSKGRENSSEAHRHVLKLSCHIKGVMFLNQNYNDLVFNQKATIYCDPPYANTVKYKDVFDSAAFWTWADQQHDSGHRVFVSEYTAPSHWHCIWSKHLNLNLNSIRTSSDTRIESLFSRRSDLSLF